MLFLIEALIKMTAFGFFNHKNSYMRDVLNVFDFFVVITSLEIYLGNTSSSFKALRVMRVVRPLRTIGRVPSMKKLVTIILKSVPEMVHTVVFFSFFLIIISILGT